MWCLRENCGGETEVAFPLELWKETKTNANNDSVIESANAGFRHGYEADISNVVPPLLPVQTPLGCQKKLGFPDQASARKPVQVIQRGDRRRDRQRWAGSLRRDARKGKRCVNAKQCANILGLRFQAEKNSEMFSTTILISVCFFADFRIQNMSPI